MQFQKNPRCPSAAPSKSYGFLFFEAHSWAKKEQSVGAFPPLAARPSMQARMMHGFFVNSSKSFSIRLLVISLVIWLRRINESFWVSFIVHVNANVATKSKILGYVIQVCNKSPP